MLFITHNFVQDIVYSCSSLPLQDSDTLKIMGKFIKKYMKMSSTSRRTQDTEEQLQERQDELEILIMTLETVALCLQGTQQCPSKIKVMTQ